MSDSNLDLPSDEEVSEIAQHFLASIEASGPQSIDEWISRHPHLGETLRETLEGAALMASLRSTSSTGQSLSSKAPIDQNSIHGRQLGDFLIHRQIGSGGMGVVYEATQISLQRRVALKVVSVSSGDTLLMDRFDREARLVASLHHANIVPVFAVGEKGNVKYHPATRFRFRRSPST